MIYSHGDIEVRDYRIFDLNGNELYHADSFLYIGTAWDGGYGTTNVYRGKFAYEFTAKVANIESIQIEGYACSYVCDSSLFPLENLPNCAFPDQHNGIGGFAPSVTHGEDDCF